MLLRMKRRNGPPGTRTFTLVTPSQNMVFSLTCRYCYIICLFGYVFVCVFACLFVSICLFVCVFLLFFSDYRCSENVNTLTMVSKIVSRVMAWADQKTSQIVGCHFCTNNGCQHFYTKTKQWMVWVFHKPDKTKNVTCRVIHESGFSILKQCNW